VRLRWPLHSLETFVVIVAGIVKASLMTLSPMSLDLAYAVHQTLVGSVQGRTPYGIFIKTMIAFWTAIPVDHPSLLTNWTVDIFQPSFGLYLLVFLLKFPLLVLDVLTAVVIYWFALNAEVGKDKARFAFFLWFLNPYVLLTNEMWGTVEILPTFLLVLAFGSLQIKRSRIWSALTYAGATAVKLFPFILLPIFLSVYRPRRKLSLLFVLACALGVSSYFAWISLAGYSPWFQLKQYDLFTQNFDEYVLSATTGAAVGLATIALIITYVLIAERWPRDQAATFDGALLILLVFFGLSSWFPQSLIWLIPFLVLDTVIGNRSIHYLIILLSSALFFDVIAFYQYFTANGNAFFFVPASNHILKIAVTAYETFAKTDAIVLFGGPFARALFFATCMIYSLRIIEKRTGLISTFIELIKHSSGGDK
jgi:hypothetical protein